MANNRVWVLIGTDAELIKMFPVLLRLTSKNIPYKIISSGQNDIDKSQIFIDFQLRRPDIYLSKYVHKHSPISLGMWFVSTLFRSLFVLKKQVRKGDIMIVHGDTVSTVMGALLGRFFGMQVMHIEAGLRSFDLLNPFPEELDRMIVSRLAHYHFCPNEWSTKHLGKKANIVNTVQNTLYESLDLALSLRPEKELNILTAADFGIVVMHRQENIYNYEFAKNVISRIVKLAHKTKIVFILHAPTKVALEKFNLYQEISSNPNITITPRMPYVDLMRVLTRAKFIITDGGSNQEECYYLGIPCLILRKKTERIEGLNGNVLLMGESKEDVIDGFINNLSNYRSSRVVLATKPSEIIVEVVQKLMQ
jgi:UDP-N-acetylglucosamine 2-epimerase (non-hydrolysing)